MLRARRDGERDDGHRVALAIEGGGMRGVVSSAMADAVEAAGLTECLDLVVGASAGALNGAALLAGVARGCTDEYAGAFSSRRFINPARLLLGRPAVNVEFVLDHDSDLLDAERHDRTVASPVELHCVATDVATAAPVDLDGIDSGEALRGALLASSRLPWVGGQPVEFRGRRWLDGGVAESIPVPAALAAGATHVLVLLTRPAGAPVDPPGSGLGERIVERRLRALNPDLVEVLRRRPVTYAEEVERIVAATARPRAEGPWVCGIWLPEHTPVPSRLERDPETLRAAAAAARERAAAVLAS